MRTHRTSLEPPASPAAGCMQQSRVSLLPLTLPTPAVRPSGVCTPSHPAPAAPPTPPPRRRQRPAPEGRGYSRQLMPPHQPPPRRSCCRQRPHPPPGRVVSVAILVSPGRSASIRESPSRPSSACCDTLRHHPCPRWHLDSAPGNLAHHLNPVTPPPVLSPLAAIVGTPSCVTAGVLQVTTADASARRAGTRRGPRLAGVTAAPTASRQSLATDQTSPSAAFMVHQHP